MKILFQHHDTTIYIVFNCHYVKYLLILGYDTIIELERFKMKYFRYLCYMILTILFFSIFLYAQINPVSSETEKRVSITTTARSVEGAPYKFNGKTPEGFDSVGYIIYVFYKNRVFFPQTLDHIIRLGNPVQPKDAKPGDILYFCSPEDPERKIEHAAVYLGKSAFIHMPPERTIVRIDHIKRGNRWAKLFVEVRSYENMYIDKNEESTNVLPSQNEDTVNSAGYEDSDYENN